RFHPVANGCGGWNFRRKAAGLRCSSNVQQFKAANPVARYAAVVTETVEVDTQPPQSQLNKTKSGVLQLCFARPGSEMDVKLSDTQKVVLWTILAASRDNKFPKSHAIAAALGKPLLEIDQAIAVLKSMGYIDQYEN